MVTLLLVMRPTTVFCQLDDVVGTVTGCTVMGRVNEVNRSGLSTHPCGTPVLSAMFWDVFPFARTVCCLYPVPNYREKSQVPGVPCVFISCWGMIMLNAELKSNYSIHTYESPHMKSRCVSWMKNSWEGILCWFYLWNGMAGGRMDLMFITRCPSWSWRSGHVLCTGCGFFGTAITMVDLEHFGTTVWLNEMLKMLVSMSLRFLAQSLRTRPGMLSGPAALRGLIFRIIFSLLAGVRCMPVLEGECDLLRVLFCVWNNLLRPLSSGKVCHYHTTVVWVYRYLVFRCLSRDSGVAEMTRYIIAVLLFHCSNSTGQVGSSFEEACEILSGLPECW